MNEEIKDLIEQLNVCSVNDYNFEIYGNEAKILNEYITILQQENARLKEKNKKAIDKLEFYNSGEALWYVPIQEIIDILKEN